ncbi:MAG: PAS domain S-box protein [Myxococcaceae bacterium]
MPVENDFARLWEVLDLAPVGIIETDVEGARTYVNVRWVELSGLRPDQVSNGGWLSAVHPEDRERVASQWLRARKNGEELKVEHRLGTPPRWVLTWARPLKDPLGNINGFLGAVTDIHERYELEAANQALLAALPVAVIVFEGEKVVLANQAFEQLSGFNPAEACAKNVWSLFTESSSGAMKAQLTMFVPHQRSQPLHLELLHKGGHPVPVETAVVLIPSGGRRRLAVVLRGRAELEAVQRASRVSERLTSIATLSGGVAHEINNPLAFVVTNLTFAHEELASSKPGAPFAADDREEILRALEEGKIGAQRIRKIVEALRTFARSDDKRRHEVEVAQALDNAVQIAAGQFPDGTELKRVEEALPPVRAPEGQLAQVFVHLLINAAEAIAPLPAGQRKIELRTRTSPEGEAVIEVIDSGQGFPKEIVDRVFDPFFTTKPIGQGAGLGLTMVHGVITQLGGRVEIGSSESGGAKVTLSLPAAQR